MSLNIPEVYIIWEKYKERKADGRGKISLVPSLSLSLSLVSQAGAVFFNKCRDI
jgi:hypothetical protein